jgi:hypothetical protein
VQAHLSSWSAMTGRTELQEREVRKIKSGGMPVSYLGRTALRMKQYSIYTLCLVKTAKQTTRQLSLLDSSLKTITEE